jgi:hypothetical protein
MLMLLNDPNHSGQELDPKREDSEDERRSRGAVRQFFTSRVPVVQSSSLTGLLVHGSHYERARSD